MNWITLIASIYHWEPRLNNDLMILIYIKINEYIKLEGGE